MGRRLLIVDDEESILLALKDLLREEGQAIDTSSNYEEALNLLAAHRYDLVIVDLRLSGCDRDEGMEILKRVHRDHPDTPVILITAYCGPEVEKQARESGAAVCFEKPFQIDLLQKTIHELLSPRSPNGADCVGASPGAGPCRRESADGHD
ncbi:MAG: response regulator [Acidobacteriota bacterium]